MTAPSDVDEDLARMRPRWMTSLDTNDYVLVRFVFLRFLGLIYVVAFLVAVNQLVPLVGIRGLEPAAHFLEDVKMALGSSGAVVRLPTLFWFGASDGALQGAAYVGLLLSASVLAGFCNSIVLFTLWALYLSI